MAWGALANAAVTALAAAAYTLAAAAAQARQRGLGRSWGAATAFFATVSLFLWLAAARQAAAWLAAAGWIGAAWDLRLYLLLIAPAALAIVPHTHLVVHVRTGSRRAAAAVAGCSAALVGVGLGFAYAGGADPVAGAAYGTDWALRSRVAGVLIFLVILLPGLAGSAWLAVSARSLPQPTRRRIGLVGWSSLAYFAIFTVDAFGLHGWPLLAARVATAGAGLLAWWAYHEPHGRARMYVPPPEPPEMQMFGR